jgi:tRNA(Arg) A34 adenosine deaminase TadA
MHDEKYMRLAIEKAKEGIAAGQSPFGAVVVRDATIVVAAAHNTVWRDTDPSAHAEVNAIRRAAARLGRISLHDCVLYSTCEPCPMCLGATHWAKVERLVFGASIADAAAAGFSELQVPATQLVVTGGSPLRVEAGVLDAECRALFQLWKAAALSASY